MEDAPFVFRTQSRFRIWSEERTVGATLFICLAISAFGQTTDQAIDEEIVELPPFLVGPTEGWVAQDTLIGTRLRTPYRDLAAQIEVLTPDFMEDFALNSIEEAAIYTINLESRDDYVQGLGYQDNLDGGMRMRGLRGIEFSRLFFRTNLPTDRYNLSRTDIASGPNTILFAHREIAGVINSDPRPAAFSNGGSFGAQFDSNGSYRFELDLNQVLVKDTLAVLGTVLYDDFKWETEPGRKLDRRFYAAATYRPFSTTEIRAYFETVDLERRVPSRSFPYDRITPWFEASELPESGYSENRPIFQNDLEWQLSNPKIPVGQQVFTQALWPSVFVVDNGVASSLPELSSWRESVQINGPNLWNHTPPLSRDYWVPFTLLDDKYFPTDKSIRSGASFQEVNGRIFNLVLNQRIIDDLHLELAGHSERVDQFDAEGLFDHAVVQVDANAYLPDGITPNPNAGRLYVESQSTYQEIPESTDQWRAALSYEYDFGEKHDGWLTRLGRHRLVGLTSSDNSSRKRQKRFYRIAPKILANGELRFPTIRGAVWDYNRTRVVWEQPNAKLSFRHYLDPTNGNIVPKIPFTIGQPLHLIDSDGDPFTVDPENTGFFDEEGHRMVLGTTTLDTQKRKENVFQISYQGYFFDERLVLTYGWRRTLLDAAGLPGARDDYTGMIPHSDDVDFGPLERFAEGNTDTKGIVLAPFRGWLDLPANADLTLFHQRSNTFDRDYGFHDPFGDLYPGSHGEGEDTGAQLSLFGDRFVIRFNDYRVAAGPRNAGWKLNGIRYYLDIIESRIRTLDPDFPLLEGSSGIGFNTPLPNASSYGLVAYNVSTGYEISGRWTPNNNLEFRFNAADMESTYSEIGLEWWEWMDRRLLDYETLNVDEGGKNNPRDLNGDGKIGLWTWETAWISDIEQTSLSESWKYNVIEGQSGKDLIQSIDGKSNPFIRELRFNVNGMYRFSEGPLRGLRLGGAVRWRESPLLTYGATTIHGTEVHDLNNPLYGDPEWYLDLVARYRFKTSWLGDRAATVSLNVRNALDRDDPIPFLLDTDGNPTRMARVDGRKFILSFKVEL